MGKFNRFPIHLFFSYVFIVFFGLLIFAVAAYLQIAANQKETALKSINELLSQANGRFDEKLLQIDRITKTIVLDYEIIDFLNQKIRSKQSFSLNDKLSLATKMNNLIVSSPYLMSVEIYNDREAISEDAYGFRTKLSSEELGEVMAARGKLVWFGYRKTAGPQSSFIPGTIVAARWFSSLDGHNKVYMVIYIRPSIFNDVFAKFPTGNTRLFLVDSGGIVLADSGTDFRQNSKRFPYPLMNQLNLSGTTVTVGGTPYYQSTYRSEYTGWLTVGQVALSDLYKSQRIIAKLFFLIGAMGFCIAFLLSYFLSIRLAKPLRTITSGILRIETGDLSVRLPVTGTLELQKVGRSFNNMADELQSMVRKLSEERHHAELAELKALQSQINPHFLYNTLDTFYWLLMGRNQEDISELIISLGHYLRYTFQDTGKIVELEEEIFHLRQYITIQKLRFPDLDFQFDIATDTAKCRIPKLLIQPLVENALSHGLQHASKDGVVMISSFIEEGQLLIRVRDNGKGMEAEQLNKIRMFLNEGMFEAGSAGVGVGLLNVHRRITLAYGGKFGLTISSELHEGTEVTLCIPNTGN